MATATTQMGIPQMPGISSQMLRKEFVEAILGRVDRHRKHGVPGVTMPRVYHVTVLSPRPYQVRDPGLQRTFERSTALQGYLASSDLYSKSVDAIRALLKEYSLTATEIQVRFTDETNALLNTVNVSLR